MPIGPVEVMALRETDVVAHVADAWARGVGGSIVTVNVDIARQVVRDVELVEVIGAADLVVADGMPLVWASRLAGRAVPQRVTGAALVHSLAEAAAEHGRSIYLLGGDPGVAEEAARRLQVVSPALTIAGCACPPFGFERDRAMVQEIVRDVVVTAPALVLVGLGFPKQERLISELVVAHPAAWYLGCGAGIAMAAGQYRRASVAAQQAGFEWMHRLRQEPRRLARRYLVQDAPFALGMLAGAAARGVVGRLIRDAPHA